MKILAIETSCDETAVCILEAKGGQKSPRISILGNALYSQVEMHAQFGGVFPALAKREHSKNLIPLLKKTLQDAGMYKTLRKSKDVRPPSARGCRTSKSKNKLYSILQRERELLEQFLSFIPSIKKPTLDYIAVTYGPGLEPALWVGINFARALALVWDVPVIPVNHMEGHLVAALLQPKSKIKNQKSKLQSKIQNNKNLTTTRPTEQSFGRANYQLQAVQFPVIVLLVSGGHTELVLMRDWLKYIVVGETRDDAVGEAFDKVARMLGLPYPGGPEIEKMAKKAALLEDVRLPRVALPRPMINSGDFNFSFSGLKTAVLYFLKKQNLDVGTWTPNVQVPTSKLNKTFIAEIAREFEDAAVEVLVTKTMKAIECFGAKTLIVGGGVSANKRLRQELTRVFMDKNPTLGDPISKSYRNMPFEFFPEPWLSTDNAIMIGMAAYLRLLHSKKPPTKKPAAIKAEGNLRLS